MTSIDSVPDLDLQPSAIVAAPAIEAHRLVKTYSNKVRALDGLSFLVEAGTVFALLGPNGAGKSTAVKILNTLSCPDSGSARVAGFNVLEEPERVRQAIGCVAQKSGVDLEATGQENLILQGHIYGLRGRELKHRVSELLERFCLTEAAHLYARTYSGGMQRKLDIAMGLIHRPSVLLLDEPTNGLDPEARADLWEEVARLSGIEGMTVLLTTHDLEEADRLAKRLAIVDRGKLVIQGSPEQLKGELCGDAIHLELLQAEAAGKVRIALNCIEAIHDLVFEGQALRIRAPHGATAVPSILAALELEGIRVTSVRIASPSLDDVYLRHTGRSFREVDSVGAR